MKMSGSLVELLQNSIDSSKANVVHFNKFVSSCLEHGSFYNQEKSEAVIKIINNSLNSSFDKETGLILLQNFLFQISADAFSSNALSWMVNCSKIISQKDGINSVIALKILSTLIRLSVKFPEVNKEAAKQIVPKFLSDHVRRKSPPEVSIDLLECVQSCMRDYPGPSGEFRLDIQRLLLSTVEDSREVVEVASRCVPLLAGVGGGGKQGVSHKTAWQRQQMALVRLLHSLLNQLYEHVDCQMEESVTTSEDVEVSIREISDRNVLTKSQRLAAQFTCVARFLQAMLLEPFPVAKAVAPDAILDVVAHAQKPTLATLGSSREALAVTAVLPTVQVAALHLLESLVVCLGRNLVPQGALVCYLCAQAVHWTHQKVSDWPYAMAKPFSQTRHAAYCCLQSWVTVAASASQLESVMDKLLPAMLADIHAEKPSVRLRVGSKTGKGRKKQQVLLSQEDRSDKLGDSTANSRLCERALLLLTTLLPTVVARLKPDMVSRITSTVLRVVADLPVPYSDTNCLIALHQLLLTLCVESHPRLAPPLQPALAVFTAGALHPVPQVRATCVAALSCLDKMIHPTSVSLYFPVTPQEGRKNDDKEEEEEEEQENIIPAPKRMKVEFLSKTLFANLVDEGQDEKELQEEQMGMKEKHGESKEDHVEMNDLVYSSDSEEVVELVPIEDVTEDIENSAEEVDVIDITEDDTPGVPQDVEEGKQGSRTILASKEKFSSMDEVIDGSNYIEENIESHLILKSGIEKKEETEECLNIKKDEISEEDADVSAMLMDFTDEVNNDDES